MKNKSLIAIGIYLTITTIIYGYAYREGIRENQRRHPHLDKEFFVDGNAFINAAFWPIYLPGHISNKLWNNL